MRFPERIRTQEDYDKYLSLKEIELRFARNAKYLETLTITPKSNRTLQMYECMVIKKCTSAAVGKMLSPAKGLNGSL